MKTLNDKQIARFGRKLCRYMAAWNGDAPERGMRARFAHEMGVTPQYLSSMTNGHQIPSDELLALLGYERAIVVRKITDENV